MRAERPSDPPRLTCETTLTALPEVRAFWATLCEDVNAPFVLVPSVATETLTRERLETTYDWADRLKWMAGNLPEVNWSKQDMRRLSVIAGGAARDHLLRHLKDGGGAYTLHRTPKDKKADLIEREFDINDAMDDRIFDTGSKNWRTDKQIVVEAMARGYDILASNNIRSIFHERLRDWLLNGAGAQLDIRSTVLEPGLAEEALRLAHNKPIEWPAHMAVRACVTNPDDERLAHAQIVEFTRDFEERGMGGILRNIEVALNEREVMQEALSQLRAKGGSRAARYEASKESSVAGAISRRTGLSVPEIMESKRTVRSHPSP